MSISYFRGIGLYSEKISVLYIKITCNSGEKQGFYQPDTILCELFYIQHFDLNFRERPRPTVLRNNVVVCLFRIGKSTFRFVPNQVMLT